MAASQALFLMFLLSVLLTQPAYTAQERLGEDESFMHRFLTTAKEQGLISEEQFSPLQDLAKKMGMARYTIDQDATGDAELTESKPSVFMRIYNHFTLLNVIYFSGTLLIMGAYTLFMTIALEKFNHFGLSMIMLVKVVVFGLLGLQFWSREDLQFVGGLFVTISTSMVPFLVYNVQRAMKVWPKKDPGIFQEFRLYIRPGWVVMEIVTVVTGLGFLSIVRFPFLLFPISFSLWFLSMDLAPLWPRFEARGWEDAFEIRRQISLGFGIGMMLAGYGFETLLGSDPDMGFWLYLFGTFTFWGSLNCRFPRYDFSGSLFLLLQILLILLGSHLDRTTLHIFGTLGVIEYLVGLCSSYIKMSRARILWVLKAASAAALFSQSLRRGGNLEILAGLVCILAFNFNYISFLMSNEAYSLFLLFTNLGFVGISASFTQPLNLWLFSIPNAGIVISIISSFLVAIFHLKLHMKYLANPPDSLKAYLYNVYRLALSVLVAFVLVSLRQPYFAWVGGLGIPLIAVIFTPTRQTPHPPGSIKTTVQSVVSFTLLLFGVAFALYLQSNFLYLICCLCMFPTIMAHLNKLKILGCILSIFLIFISVPFQSSFLITIGAIYIFSYLSYLAYDYFKNSLLFPLALITLGLGMIFCAIQYQKIEQEIHDTLYAQLPRPLTFLLTQTLASTWQEGGAYDWFGKLHMASFSVDSFLSAPQNWILWPGALTFALTDGPPPYVTVSCGLAIVVFLLAAAFMSYRQSLVKNLDDSVKVGDIKFSLSQDPVHENHGIVIKVKGHKPRNLAKPVHLALNVEGRQFWQTAQNVFGEFPVNIARSLTLPYKLTPHLISFTGFKEGQTQFTCEILLGTGHKGSQRMKHTTATNALRRLTQNNQEAEMTCVVVYSNSWLNPWSKLCVTSIQLKEVKQQLSP